jgi:hypothetical protein
MEPRNRESRGLSPIGHWRYRILTAGLQEMESNLTVLRSQLSQAQLSPLDRMVMAGQLREMRCAYWLVQRMLPLPAASEGSASQSPFATNPFAQTSAPALTQNVSLTSKSSGSGPVSSLATLQASTDRLTKYQTLLTLLINTTREKARLGLQNLTPQPLEIDILKPDKRQELLEVVLQQFEQTLQDLQASEVTITQLTTKRSQILLDLWQGSITSFFGRYTTLPFTRSLRGSEIQEIEIVPGLLAEQSTVEIAILDKIPLVTELFEHLLFQIPLVIDNTPYSTGTLEAMRQAEALLQNLVVQVANAVIQPLLNQFGDMEAIKQNFYDRRVLPTRDLERFRNTLSWKYRVGDLFNEPTAIFESRYDLVVLSDRGLVPATIYAPRDQELRALRGLRLLVTLALEAKDAVTPPLQATVAFVGRGIVYVLTQVIGRGIGLIGRGIVQGIGSSWQEVQLNRRGQQQK